MSHYDANREFDDLQRAGVPTATVPRRTPVGPKGPPPGATKDARKAGKVRVDLIDPVALIAVGRVLEWGCRAKDSGGKGYAEWDWRKNMTLMDCIGAMERHLAKLKNRQETDGESGESHAHHATSTAIMLSHFMDSLDKYPGIDDRPPQAGIIKE